MRVCYYITRMRNGPLAQPVEHWTFNPGVRGSNPRRLTHPNHFRDEVVFCYLKFGQVWFLR